MKLRAPIAKREASIPLVPVAIGIERELVGCFDVVLLKFSEQTFVRQIEPVGMFPIVIGNFHDAFNYVAVIRLDGQLPTTVKATRCEIDGPDDDTPLINQQHFPMKLEVFQSVNLDSNVGQNAKPPNSFSELLLL